MDKPKRNKIKQISYAEVDSDVDLPSDEEKKFEDQLDLKGNKRRRKRVKEGDSDVDDTTEATTMKKKKNNKQDKSIIRKKKHKYNSKMLLELPFDLFAELCTHLDFKDLMSLAKVNKSLHKLLLSRAARPIFAGIRRRDGFPLPDDMSELKFAVFLVGASCEGCGTRSYLERSLFLRKCLCKECSPKYFISSRKLSAKWPELHSRAIDCIRFDQGWITGSTRMTSRRARFLISDLVEANRELHDAEADDEIDSMVLETKQDRNQSSSSRRRRAFQHDSGEVTEDSSQMTSRVERYVEEKQEWVTKQQNASISIKNVELKLRIEQNDRRGEIWSKTRSEREELFDSYTIELEELDWSPEDIEACLNPFIYGYRSPPKASPSANLDQWKKFLARCNPTTRDYETMSKLYESLHLFYDALKLSEAPRHFDIFPTTTEFRNFKAARSYLDNEKSKPLTKSHWLKLLPSILDELAKYYEAIRIEAIRSILAARQGVSVTKISPSPQHYPESLYPDSFFNLATSLFPPSRYASNQELLPYPQAGTGNTYDSSGKGTFSHRSESRTALTIQAIIGAAGLDSSTATAEDLDAVGRRFTWDNDTREAERDTLRTWRELVELVRKRGPNKTKYKDGSATTIVSYFPQVDVDGTTYMDNEGDGPGDLVNNSDDEEEEEEEEREARRRGENYTEGKNGEGDSESIDGMEEEKDYEE